MTKTDLENILNIIETLVKEEKKHCNRYIELNPDDARDARKMMLDRTSVMHYVWRTIQEKYADVWKEKKA